MSFKIFDLGLANFQRALDFQKETHSAVKNNGLSSALILCRHYPVITLGRPAHRENILITEAELRNRGIAVYEIERGGDVTCHGPGQLMVYPVFNLNYLKKDIHWFLRQLEETVIVYLSSLGIKGERRPGLTGVWINRRKISSIGIAIKNWTTFHGLSLNVLNSDLANYKLIKPCGMNIEMTSLEDELGRIIEFESVNEGLIRRFQGVFSMELKDA